MTERQNRAQVGRLILFTTLWLTLFILSVKVSAAWASRSLSLMAESLQTLVVSFSTLLSLLKVTPTDRPQKLAVSGHGKRETAITFLLVAFLGFVGLNLLVMSAQQLAVVIQEAMLIFPVHVSLPLIELLGVVAVTSLGLTLLCTYEAKILSHSALRFNANQLFKDVWLIVLVIAGLLGAWWGLKWIDAALAILILLLVIGSFWQVVSWQLPLLVRQTAIAPEILAQIARQVGGVTHCYKIQSRGLVGRSVQVQMHLIIHPEFTEDTSLIVERIEHAIQERYGLVQVTFYIDDDSRESTSPYHVNWTPDIQKINGKSHLISSGD